MNSNKIFAYNDTSWTNKGGGAHNRYCRLSVGHKVWHLYRYCWCTCSRYCCTQYHDRCIYALSKGSTCSAIVSKRFCFWCCLSILFPFYLPVCLLPLLLNTHTASLFLWLIISIVVRSDLKHNFTIYICRNGSGSGCSCAK